MNCKDIKIIFSLILLILTVNTTFSQSYTTTEGDSINPKVYISAGYFFPNINTGIRIDSSIGIGTEINLEDDLKLEDNISVFKAGSLIRLSPKSQLLLSYSSMKRDRTLTLEEDIKFEDTTFYIGARANIKFDVNYYALTWRYSFFNEKNWNAGLSLGARGISLSTSLKALLNENSYSESVNFTAPAIVLGLHGSAYLTSKLLARYSLEYLYLDIGGIDITILETEASLNYYMLKKCRFRNCLFY